MLALLFSVQSISAVQSTSYAIPIAQLYFDAIGQKLALMCITVIALAQFMAAVTAFTASSRLFYALARDNGVPMKRYFMFLNRFQAPLLGVWLSVLIGSLVSCAYIASVIAVSNPVPLYFNDPPNFMQVQCNSFVRRDLRNARVFATDHHSCILAICVCLPFKVLI